MHRRIQDSYRGQFVTRNTRRDRAAFRRNTRSIYFFCKAAVLHVVWLLSTAVSQHAQCGVALASSHHLA